MLQRRLVRIAVLILCALCAFGMISSAVVHVAAFLPGDPTPHVPRVFALGFGVLVVGVSVTVLYRCREGSPYGPPLALSRTARWPLYALFGYGAINVIFHLYFLNGGVPDIRDGAYVLRHSGPRNAPLLEIPISREEYLYYVRSEIRLFSSAYMAVYYMMLVQLWPFQKILASGFREWDWKPDP